MRAMVLAAGFGKRLRPLTFDDSEAARAGREPAGDGAHRRALRGQGFGEVIANLSDLGDRIRGHFGDGSALGVDLSYSEEEELLGTAGGVRNVADFLTGGEDDSFLVISGDALTDIDLKALRERHASHDGIATLAVKRVPDTREYGVVIHGADGRVQGFQEKPDPAEALSDLGNCGIYVFRKEIFDYFPARPFVDGRWTSSRPCWRRTSPSTCTSSSDYWNDIGSLDEYRAGQLRRPRWSGQAARRG